MQNYLPETDLNQLRELLRIKEAYLHGQMGLEEARAELRKTFDKISPYHIAVAEQKLKEFEDHQCEKEDIQGMLDLYEGLMDTSRPKLPEDHPINCYYRENDELRKILASIEDLVQYPIIKNQWYELYDRLQEWKRHLSRKQNQLYTVLEKKGFDRPTTTMWTLDDFIRDEIGEARALLEEDKEDEFIAMQETLTADIRDLMSKEENVLYPTALAMITPDEFEYMKAGDREIGYAWIKVGKDESKAAERPAASAPNESFAAELSALLQKHGFAQDPDAPLKVTTGELSLKQINLIYKHLPVDISYVDENEIVKFYSDTEHRVFPRSRNVIGRDVKNCHPRNSVHIVKEIVEKFRSGEEDSAEFWINKPGLFIYIYYAAVRDEDGTFRGVLEMMQDCTHIRALQDSQTLLTWGREKEEETADGAEGSSEAEESLETEAPSDEADETSSGFEPIDPERISEDTMLKDLIARYPRLKGDLSQISPKFKALQGPLARIMLPKATIKAMSERSGVPADTIIGGIRKLIRSYGDEA